MTGSGQRDLEELIDQRNIATGVAIGAGSIEVGGLVDIFRSTGDTNPYAALAFGLGLCAVYAAAGVARGAQHQIRKIRNNNSGEYTPVPAS